MSTKHQRRAAILTHLVAGKVSHSEAAQLLGLCARQVRRLCRRFTVEGIAAVVHGNTGRAPRFTLVRAVDDATGKLIYAYFRPSEDQAGYLMMLRSIAQEYGLPEALYHDRHTILRAPKEPTIEDEFAGKRPQSQLQTIIAELDITSISALSAQGKGRVERL